MRTRRLVVLVLLAASLAGAALYDREDDDRVVTRRPAIEAGVAMPVMAPAGSVSTTWYCAAGTAQKGGIADHTVVIANPTDQSGTGTLTVVSGAVAKAKGPRAKAPPEPVEEAFTIGPHRRVAFELSDLVDAQLASAVVEVRGAQVAVDHQLSGKYGTDTAPCASAASDEWHFAWGSTRRDTHEILALFNPFPDDATIDVHFVTDDGPREPVRYDGFVVPGRSVVGVDIGDDVTRRDHVATTIRARAGRIVVDRIQGYDGRLGTEGLTVTLGTPQPALVWVFPDGIVRDGIIERYAIYNPSDRPAEVELEVRLDDAAVRRARREQDDDDPPIVQPEPFELTIPAHGYALRTLNDEDRVPEAIAHLGIVRSLNGVGVVAERMVFAKPPSSRRDISVTPGSPFAATTWVLAAGSATDSIDEWLTIVNMSSDANATVSVSALASGQVLAVNDLQALEIPPGTRLAIRVGEHVKRPDLALVVSADVPVVVERSLYRVGGLGMSASMGIPRPPGLVVPPPIER